MIVCASVLLSCWARVIVDFFYNLSIGRPYLHVICKWWGKSETLVFFGGLLSLLTTEMVACIRYEDRLDGMSNYLQWRVRMTVVLK